MEENALTAVKTDASTKILGTKYQELYALAKCLDADDNSKIYLECYGDVSDGITSTEIKSSIDSDKTLYDTHIDFWKTLANLVENYDEFSGHTQFILYTTAKVKDKSIFVGWNKQRPSKKRSLVLGVIPNATINKHYQKVKDCQTAQLETILGKLSIDDENKVIGDFYDDLLNHPAIINSLAEEQRDALLQRLLGYVSKRLISSAGENYRWMIDVNEFRETLRFELKKYQMDDLVFPYINRSAFSDSSHTYRFTDEMKRIEFMSAISVAVNDYLRSQQSRIAMLTQRPLLSEELDNYDESIYEHMTDVHLSHSDKLRQNANLTEQELVFKSREFYNECLEKSKAKLAIVGVQRVSDYYPKGRVHHNVELRSDFTWKLARP